MADEITVPLLPCRSIDEMAEFYTMLGFTRSYYQTRPNPYVSLEREGIRLDFFGMPDFEPADSYGTCLVIVPDTRTLFDAFAAGMRAVHGKLLVAGIPRMTRPRKRKNADNHSGFTVIDPGGNWIRIVAAAPDKEQAGGGKLSVTLARAVVMGDSHGKHERAAQILDAALERDKATATAAELVEALAYRAELAIRAGDTAAAVAALERARALALTETERDTVAESLAALADIELGLHSPRMP
ncbi:VOC family protein [Nocardia cyriacigeorgica]|uniref:VOC family protein n=1 Tax=Nocardia cyriacigeorgica TaxID=135487 RepID=UPI0018931ABC|nr:VOC family protein [Nocardia cyriacigeorgica]MBF6088322.1 VOC family protein [Nocardia cyriacigeorgica]